MDAMPTIHYQPMAMTEGMNGCGGCHKSGLKSPEQVAELAKSGVHFGNASCDSSHTRHTFSIEEAKSAQAEFADMPDLPHAGRKSRSADGVGFLAVRLPMPEDKDWPADRVTVLQALGVLTRADSQRSCWSW